MEKDEFDAIPSGWQNCPHCRGLGSTPGLSAAKGIRCGVCGGEGVVTDAEAAAFVPVSERVTCPDCEGAGRDTTGESPTCPQCKGACHVRRESPVAVVAPEVADAFGLRGNPAVVVADAWQEARRAKQARGAKHGLI